MTVTILEDGYRQTTADHLDNVIKNNLLPNIGTFAAGKLIEYGVKKLAEKACPPVGLIVEVAFMAGEFVYECCDNNTYGGGKVYQIKTRGYIHSYLVGSDTSWQYYERTIIMYQNGDDEWELLHEDYYWGERR